MAVLGQFRQAENMTGSFDETAGYRSWRSPLELCSMWSLRVTKFAQHARRRSGWRVARGVDKKCQKTENNIYRWQCTIIGTLFLKGLKGVLFSMLSMCAGMKVWCTLIHWHWDWCLCPSACSAQKLDFEKVPHEKGKRRELYMQFDPGDVSHCFMRSPYRCKLEHRLWQHLCFLW